MNWLHVMSMDFSYIFYGPQTFLFFFFWVTSLHKWILGNQAWVYAIEENGIKIIDGYISNGFYWMFFL
jgi:hypothetical protein